MAQKWGPGQGLDGDSVARYRECMTSPQQFPPPYAPPHQQGYMVAPKNTAATAGLVLGIIGFFVTPIPLFIGLAFGGIPDILAIIFSIIGLVKAPALGGVGKTKAVWGLVLGCLGFFAIFLGAGTVW